MLLKGLNAVPPQIGRRGRGRRAETLDLQPYKRSELNFLINEVNQVQVGNDMHSS